MKTPEQIKASLMVTERVHYHGRDPEPRFTPMEFVRFERDVAEAFAYIRKLEDQNAEQAARLEQVTRESDKVNGDLISRTCTVDVDEVITGSPAAMAYIQSLERHNVELMARIKLGQMLEAQLKRERDAALKDIPRVCAYCKHFVLVENTPACNNWECVQISGMNTGWEWRGVAQEGEHENI